MARIKIAFIINPHSGTNDKHDLPDLIKANLDKDKFDITTVFTQYAGHGRELAAQYATDGFDAVVACGGDGTVNEVASSLTDTPVAFGIIPFGSGNGLARHLHIALTPVKAIRQINNFHVQKMDYGVENGRKFFCTCGTGFDAHVSFKFTEQGTRGLWTYLKVIVREYWKYEPLVYTIVQNGEERKEKAFVVTFANACQYGNDGFIAPQASTSDGLLDISVIHPFRFWSVPRLAFDLLTQRLDRNPHVSITRAASASVIRPDEGPFHFDGDPVKEAARIDVHIVPGGLNVIAD